MVYLPLRYSVETGKEALLLLRFEFLHFILFSNTKSEHEYGMNLDFASASKTLATRKTKTSCMEEARVALQSYQK